MAHFLSALIRIVYPCDIDHHAQLGKISIPHATGIVIGDSAVIEDDVLIMQNVTIGRKYGHDGQKGHAHICKGAILGAGCAILGPITIGECAKIGANAVITKDVPPYAVVVGNNHIVRTETPKIEK